MSNSFDFMKDVLATPLGEMISSVGAGVAEAQASLDAGSLAQLLAIYNLDNKDELTTLLREIGYQPTFYTLPETEVEAQISLSLSINEGYQSTLPSQTNNSNKTKIYATPSNASINNKYNLNVNAFSKIKFKIVPVPSPIENNDLRIVPNIVNKTKAEAENLLAQLGLTLMIDNATNTLTTVAYQDPLPGAILRTSKEVKVR